LGKRNAEFRALQSQIQPHFLYNTLNGLIGLNRSGQQRLLEKAILSLSGMLRYTLEHEDMTTLADEMVFLKQYCELQKLRFGDRLEYDFDLQPEAASCQLPKLVLQPIVENAIIHGIEPLGTTGKLTVRAEQRTDAVDNDNRLVYIRIEDNGTGFDRGLKQEGVGIANVRERLYLFDRSSRLDVNTVTGKGTVVEIWIPAKEMNYR